MSKFTAAVGGLFIGGLVGIGVGMLVAPKSGAETRADLSAATTDLFGAGVNSYGQNPEQFQAQMSSSASGVGRRNDEMQAKIENARAIIAEQVSRNAAIAHEQIDKNMPIVAEKVTEAADAAQSAMDDLAEKIAPKKDAAPSAPAAE
jgi:gas vesicle protein